MFSFNLIFFIGGCGILGLGIWLKVEKEDYMELTSFNFVSTANIAIAVGVIIVLVAFLGCCGAINEVAPMLLAFYRLRPLQLHSRRADVTSEHSARDDVRDGLGGVATVTTCSL